MDFKRIKEIEKMLKTEDVMNVTRLAFRIELLLEIIRNPQEQLKSFEKFCPSHLGEPGGRPDTPEKLMAMMANSSIVEAYVLGKGVPKEETMISTPIMMKVIEEMAKAAPERFPYYSKILLAEEDETDGR